MKIFETKIFVILYLNFWLRTKYFKFTTKKSRNFLLVLLIVHDFLLIGKTCICNQKSNDIIASTEIPFQK